MPGDRAYRLHRPFVHNHLIPSLTACHQNNVWTEYNTTCVAVVRPPLLRKSHSLATSFEVRASLKDPPLRSRWLRYQGFLDAVNKHKSHTLFQVENHELSRTSSLQKSGVRKDAYCTWLLPIFRISSTCALKPNRYCVQLFAGL